MGDNDDTWEEEKEEILRRFRATPENLEAHIGDVLKEREDKYVSDPVVQTTAKKILGTEEDEGFFARIFSGFGAAFPPLFIQAFQKLGEQSTSVVKEWASDILNQYKDDGYLTQDTVDYLLSMNIKSGIGGLLFYMALAFSLAIGRFSAHFRAVLAPIEYGVNQHHHPNLPDPFAMLHAGFVCPETIPLIREIFDKQGIDEKHTDLAFKSRYATYSAIEAIHLHRKGKIDDSELFTRTRENGLTDDRTNELYKITDQLINAEDYTRLWLRGKLDETGLDDKLYKIGLQAEEINGVKELSQIIPPIQDILTMLAREAFEEEQVALMGLDDEFPEDVYEHGKKLGLSEFWLKRYWRAHWQQPSMLMMFQMLHRQVVTEEDVYEFMRVIEIPPFWRRKLMQISYYPYTRVDVRRMHAVGTIGDEELIKAYRDAGFDQEHAVNLAEFTIRYNQTGEKGLTRAQLERAYKTGYINEQEFSDSLQSLGYSEDTAAWIVGLIDLQVEQDEQDDTIDLIRQLYLGFKITYVEAKTRLSELNLTAIKIEKYLATWYVEQLKRHRNPTKDQIDEMLMLGVIESTRYIEYLIRLGYSPDTIADFVNLIAIKLGVET